MKLGGTQVRGGGPESDPLETPLEIEDIQRLRARDLTGKETQVRKK